MNKSLEDIEKKLQAELDSYKIVQKEHQKMATLHQQFDSQLIENEVVKKELELLKKENQVYKLVGPVLIKIDQEEARQNVAKRIEYINQEIKRLNDNLISVEKKQDTHRDNLQKLQQQFQQLQLKAAIKA